MTVLGKSPGACGWRPGGWVPGAWAGSRSAERGRRDFPIFICTEAGISPYIYARRPGFPHVYIRRRLGRRGGPARGLLPNTRCHLGSGRARAACVLKHIALRTEAPRLIRNRGLSRPISHVGALNRRGLLWCVPCPSRTGIQGSHVM